MTALAVESTRLTQNQLTRDRVLRLLGVTERTLRGWEALGVAPKCESYSFRDLARLRKLAFLSTSGPRLTGARLKKLIDAMARRGDVQDPLHDLRIYTDRDGKLRVDVAGQSMDPRSGQILLDFDAKPQNAVAFPVAAAEAASASRANSKKKSEAESWFERGLSLEQTGAPEPEIRAAYEKAVELDPQSTGALVNLGTLHFNARRLSKALDCYARAVQVDPQYALAHFNLGNLYDERGDAAKALAHYEDALRLNPNYPDAHYNLALLLQNQGQSMRAVTHWKHYLRLDPRSNWADVARREMEKLKEAALVK